MEVVKIKLAHSKKTDKDLTIALVKNLDLDANDFIYYSVCIYGRHVTAEYIEGLRVCKRGFSAELFDEQAGELYNLTQIV